MQEKCFAFSILIVETYKYLISRKGEFILSKQLLRCGTGIGANLEEAIGACSKTDFAFKLSIAYKEARESIYWLKLLSATNYLETRKANILIRDAEEICRIIGASQVTIKKSIAEKKP